MEDYSFWQPEDLSNAGSRGWKKRFADWVKDHFPDLGVYPVVGAKPRPICFVYKKEVAALASEWRGGPQDKGRGERWAYCCSKAKFAVFVGSGRADYTWGVVSAQQQSGEIAFGFYIENGYGILPKEKGYNPFADEGIDSRNFIRTSEWDWNRFRKMIDTNTGRDLINEIMLTWQFPLYLRISPVTSNVNFGRRFWFEGKQLFCKDEGSSKDPLKTSKGRMWDWILDKADHKSAWMDLMLLDFIPHKDGRVTDGITDRVRLLLDAVMPLLNLSWGE